MNVNDINDNVPTFPRDYEGPFDVTEGQPGPRVWTFLAHDQDSGPNGQVEYSIVDGDPLGEWGLSWVWRAAQPGASPLPHLGAVALSSLGLSFPTHKVMGILFSHPSPSSQGYVRTF